MKTAPVVMFASYGLRPATVKSVINCRQHCFSRVSPGSYTTRARFSRNCIVYPSRKRCTVSQWTMGTRRGKSKAGFSMAAASEGGALPTLDLTEDNVRQVLSDARIELSQLFDESVGITGEAELAELDGPFVKIRLMGRFWHKRSTVVARLGNYLKQRIPEILEVEIEDEKQLDDSPQNF